MMLRVDDCIALSDLTEEEIAAIAEHEHIPAIAAAEMGAYLMRMPGGEMRLKRIILDDIAAARARDDWAHALALRLVLRNFIAEHGSQPCGD